jgi:hypothetical protein
MANLPREQHADQIRRADADCCSPATQRFDCRYIDRPAGGGARRAGARGVRNPTFHSTPATRRSRRITALAAARG